MYVHVLGADKWVSSMATARTFSRQSETKHTTGAKTNDTTTYCNAKILI